MARRHLAALLLALATSAVGWAPAACAATKVYMMRGLADVSTGLDDLALKLKRHRIATTVESYTAQDAVTARAIADYKASGGPIVIVGHSLGADAAITMAERLRASGVPVALIVAFSPASARAVPGNVARVVNYYQSNSSWNYTYRPGIGFHGALRNINLSKDDSIHHFNIEKVERLHQVTIAQIRGLASPPGSAASTRPALPAVATGKVER